MTLDLTDDEARVLAKHLRRTIDDDPFPLAPRLDPLKAVLAKLDPPALRPEPLPPLKPGDAPSVGRSKWTAVKQSRTKTTAGRTKTTAGRTKTTAGAR